MITGGKLNIKLIQMIFAMCGKCNRYAGEFAIATLIKLNGIICQLSHMPGYDLHYSNFKLVTGSSHRFNRKLTGKLKTGFLLFIIIHIFWIYLFATHHSNYR